MKDTSKKLLSLLLCLAMLLSLLPVGLATATEATSLPQPQAAEAVIPSDADYADADAVFEQITAMEQSPAKKSSSQAQLADAAIAIVEASDSYVEGSLKRNGDAFTWMTKAGIRMHLGKGELKKETIEMFKEYGAVYAVIAPVTALLGSKVISQKCVAHPELGMEACYELIVDKFPCIIAAAHGESMF